MTHSGGKPHLVGDRGQRYEVSFFDPANNKRQVLGWTDDIDTARKMADGVEAHPAWELPWITDRKAASSRGKERDTIFVFGSNLSGRHGKGSALEAFKSYGAKMGVGKGRTGQAYAIATKDKLLRVLPLEEVARQVVTFIDYARQNPQLHFRIVDIGCGLAGYSADAIAPLFDGAPSNCEFIGRLRHLLIQS